MELDELLSTNNFAAVAKLEEMITYCSGEERIFPSLKIMRELLHELNFREAKNILQQLGEALERDGLTRLDNKHAI